MKLIANSKSWEDGREKMKAHIADWAKIEKIVYSFLLNGNALQRKSFKLFTSNSFFSDEHNALIDAYSQLAQKFEPWQEKDPKVLLDRCRKYVNECLKNYRNGKSKEIGKGKVTKKCMYS